MKRLLLHFVLVGLAACGGSKRPPAVATAPPGAAAQREAPARAPGTETVEAGPDIRAFDEGRAAGSDIADLEGGPLADVHFEFDSARLSDEARAILERHAVWLQTHRDARVTIEGHCDERGTVEYNLALGDQRAQAAKEYLASLGVAGERLTTVSFGKEKPLDPGHDEAAWARNRRAHFVVAR
jgi:peptidoglycan-associated lipoprotein